MHESEVRRVEFFYDFVCPWAFLAWRQISALAGETGAELALRPILLGGVFRSIGSPDVPAEAMGPRKAALAERDLLRFAARDGVTLRRPEAHPRRSVLALRAALCASDLARASDALFRAYWLEGRDIEKREHVGAALDGAGLDGAAALAAAEGEAAKAELRRRTDEAVAAGVFGVPTTIAHGPAGAELFWGRDRLDLVRRHLAAPPPLVVWFDFSSPYAYLGLLEARGVAARTGARLVLRPLLLGALFRALGTPDVPLFAMPEAKRRYMGVELERWAAVRGLPFRFTSRFPVNTTKPLRLVLLAPEAQRPALVERIFRALWAEDRDVTSDVELARIAADAGVDPALVDRLAEPSVKDLLRAATAEAEAAGVFGVPTFDVGEERFWGQDRLAEVERELVRQGEIAASSHLQGSSPPGDSA